MVSRLHNDHDHDPVHPSVHTSILFSTPNPYRSLADMSDPTSRSGKEERDTVPSPPDVSKPVVNVPPPESESSSMAQLLWSALSQIQRQSERQQQQYDQQQLVNDQLMSLLMEMKPAHASSVPQQPSIVPPMGVRTPTTRRTLPPIPEVPRSAGLAPRSLFQSARPLAASVLPPVAPTFPAPVLAVPISASESSLPIIRRRVEAPTKFKGTPQETAGARVWLSAARIYLSLAAENEQEHVLVNMFSLLLDGSAQAWFTTLQQRLGDALTLEVLFAEFVLKYVSVFNSETADLKLCSLVYGEGKCKDLNATEVEFDSLVSEMCQGTEHYDGATNLLLASRYQEVIRNGDGDLWAKAAETGPRTLEEWKAAVKTAFAIRQMRSVASRLNSGRGNQQRNFSSSSFSSSSSSRPATAAVQNVQARVGEVDEKGQTWERQEGEAPSTVQSEQLQQVKAKTEERRRYGSHLTHEQRVKLAHAEKCWLCYKVGHIALRCPDKDQSGVPRKPTDVDLNS